MITLRKHSAVRGILLVTVPLVILTSVALVTLRKGPVPDQDHPKEGGPPAYTFNLLYAILHDDAHGPLPPEEIYARRLARLETVIERESFGRIMVSPRLHFIPQGSSPASHGKWATSAWPIPTGA